MQIKIETERNLMNAHEYLKFLENCFDNDDIDEMTDGLKKYGKLRGAQTGEKFIEDAYSNPQKIAKEVLGTDNLKEGQTNLIRKFVYKPILSSIPSSVSNKLDNVPVGVLPIRSVNAHVLKSPNGDPLIILDRGLMLMSHYYLEVMISLPVIIKKHNADMATKHLIESYLFIINYFASAGNMPYPEKMVELPYQMLATSLQITMAIETFALCHELAHIYAGHIEKSPAKSFSLIEKSEEDTNFYQMSQKQELEADSIAWEWYLMTIKNNKFIQGIIPTAALYFFTLLSLVEKNLGVPDKYTTHPPAVERLRELLLKLNPENESSETQLAMRIWESTQSVPGPAQFKDYFAPDSKK